MNWNRTFETLDIYRLAIGPNIATVWHAEPLWYWRIDRKRPSKFGSTARGWARSKALAQKAAGHMLCI